jgi:hypothetical protein
VRRVWGDTGAAGPTGVTGAQGLKGATGENGSQGPSGLGTPGVASNTAEATRTSNSYATPNSGTGTNPSVTLTTGTRAMVIITGLLDPPGGEKSAAIAYESFAVSGATTQAASDDRAVIREHGTSSDTGVIQASTTTVITNLNPGPNTFTLQYKSSIGTANFSNRSISVIPLG